MRLISGLLICLVCAGLGSAQETEQQAFTAAVDADGIQRIEIVAGEYFFDPEHIVVKVNSPVELTVRKDPSVIPHNIVIDAPEAGMVIRESVGRDPKVIRFTPVSVGTYPFYCDKRFLFFKNHREKGMKGVIEVIP